MTGHPEALREWRGEDIGWKYADETNLIMHEMLLILFDVNLVVLDNFIEQLEAEGVGAGIELRERRRDALRLFRDQFMGKVRSHNKITDHAFAGHIEWIMRRKQEIERNEFLLPLARLGKRFKQGRKKGSAGPVRKAIARRLRKNPLAKNPEIWEALRKAPPRGWQFFENRQGQYIEHQDGYTGRHHFNTICGEERKKIRG